MEEMHGYEPKTLRKLQLLELEVFKEFIQICAENDLTYFLYSGCAIGVERHTGFIPWDDDIDIAMPRADYEKIIQIYQTKYTEKYRVLNNQVTIKFPFYNTQIVLKGTKNIPVIFKDLDLPMGVDIAIFPFDNVADEPSKRKKQVRAMFFWHKIRILRDISTPVIALDGWKKVVVSLACKMVHGVLAMCCVSRNWINKQYYKNATKYNGQETKMITSFFETYPLLAAIERDELFPLQEKQFEDIMVKVPNKNHEYLTRMYGDYMQLPPVEKRRNHAPEVLDFGPYQ